MNYKKWVCLSPKEEQNQGEILAISNELHIRKPTAALLFNRGIYTPEKARAFLTKSDEFLFDPFLLKDVEKGANRILSAIKNEENICVYGDYDVDGVTSVSCLVLYLRSLGANVTYYIPSRQGDGYGVSMNSIKRIAEEGINLIITVDTGITAVEQIEYAKEHHIDVVLTDHHECHEKIPEAVAVINPKQKDCPYPFKELAGVGVVFKLLCVLRKLSCPSEDLIDSVRYVCLNYGDLVAIGTIADVMPIVEENRLIVSYGLKMVQNTKRIGLKALLNACEADNVSNKKRAITTGYVSFSLAPRINAVGRMKEAGIAAELFLTEDPEEAKEIAEILCSTNKDRQENENEIVQSIREKYSEDFITEKSAIVLSDDHWHHGIIGIVASRMTEKYRKPSIMISFEPIGEEAEGDQNRPISPEDIGKGSCRSVPGISLMEVLAHCRDLLEQFGGHELAAGLTIRRKNLPAFEERINDYVREISMSNSRDILCVSDMELEADDLCLEQAKELLLLEPYGVGNTSPVFYVQNCRVLSVSEVSDRKHLRYSFGLENGKKITAMKFRSTLDEFPFIRQDVVDVICSLDINNYLGVESPQLVVNEIRYANKVEQSLENQTSAFISLYQQYSKNTNNEIESCRYPLPTRDDFVAVYKLIRSKMKNNCFDGSLRCIEKLFISNGKTISRFQLLTSLIVFKENGIFDIQISEAFDSDEPLAITEKTQNGKVDLTQSAFLQFLSRS